MHVKFFLHVLWKKANILKIMYFSEIAKQIPVIFGLATVVGRRVAPENFYFLISGTCEYVVLKEKGGLRLLIELRLLIC